MIDENEEVNLADDLIKHLLARQRDVKEKKRTNLIHLKKSEGIQKDLNKENDSINFLLARLKELSF